MTRRMIIAATILAAALTSTMPGAQAKEICVAVPAGIAPICIGGDPDPLCSRAQDPGRQDGQQSPLCANGPAECIAIGLAVMTDPAPLLPGGVYADWSRSHALAYGFNGFGYGHGDTAVQRASVPPALGEGVIESSCDARSQGGPDFLFNYARGTAETARLSLDLASYGVPVQVQADVLREDGFAMTGGGGTNDANVVDVLVTSSLFSPIAVSHSEAKNTSYPIPGLGTLYLNEEFIGLSPFGCITHSGDALRLVLNRPLIGGTVTVIVSWVSNAAC